MNFSNRSHFVQQVVVNGIPVRKGGYKVRGGDAFMTEVEDGPALANVAKHLGKVEGFGNAQATHEAFTLYALAKRAADPDYGWERIFGDIPVPKNASPEQRAEAAKENALRATARAKADALANDPEIQEKINVTEKFIAIAMDEPDREFVSRCIIEFVKNQVPNMLLIPSFPAPIYDSVENAGFNLFDLYRQETKHYFPSLSVYDVQTKYHDARQGHLCESTQTILAKEISQQLRPGLFVTDYDKFPKPTQSVDQIFSRK
jgi:hypothetical protein